MNLYNIEYLHFALNESRGVVDNYDLIAEEVFKNLCMINPILLDSTDGIYMRKIDNLKIKENCFIDNLSIIYYSINNLSINTSGKFIPDEQNKENLSKNNKLINCKIILYEKTDNPNKIDKSQFMESFSHEISHAFRYYSIISKNNFKIPDSVKRENFIYSSIKDKSLFSQNEKIRKFINGIIYLIDNDEISAFSNETYEQLRQNTNINRFNIQDHLTDFRMYRNLLLLKTYLSRFDGVLKDINMKNNIRTILNKLYGTNYNGDKGIKLFRQKMAKYITKISSQFMKVLEKGLIDFSRESNYYREGFSEKELENILNEIKF